MTGPSQKNIDQTPNRRMYYWPGLPRVFVVVSLLEKENFHVDGAEAEVGWI